MAASQVVPEGFELETPEPPAGFVLDGKLPPKPPEGFELEMTPSRAFGEAVDSVAGGAEAVANLASGIASQIPAGLAGMAAVSVGHDDPASVVNKVSEALTYQPRTEQGKAAAEMVAVPFEKLQQGIRYVGENVQDRNREISPWLTPEQSAVVPTAVEAGLNAALMAVPLKGGKRKPVEVVKDAPEPPQGFVLDRSVGASETKAITPETKLGEALDSVGIKQVGKEIVDLTGGKSVTYLDDLAKSSPTAKKLRDEIEYTEFSTEPIAPSFYERTSLKTGEFVTRLDTELENLRGTLSSKLPKEVNTELLGALRGEKASPEVTAVSKSVRNLLNDVREYARESGVEVGFIENYVPRVYKKDLLRTDKGRNDFITVLQKHGIEATVADDIVSRIVNNDGILTVDRGASERVNPSKPHEPYDHGRVMQTHRPRIQKQLETSRTLARIPDKELSEFLEGNVPALLSKYVQGVVKRSEYARSFGPGEGKLNQMVRDIVKESNESGRPVKPAEIQRIYDLADALQGQYRPILSNVGRNANQLVTTYQYLRTLPLATISSLSEPFLAIARGRTGVMPQALVRSLDHATRETIRTVFRKVPKAEATKALEDIGLGLDAALSERLTSTFGGEVTQLTSRFFKAIFLHQWTKFTRVLANEAGKLMVERHLKDLTKGVDGKRGLQLERELSELGIPVKEGKEWVGRGAKTDDPFYPNIKAAGLRFTNEVVMNPRATNRPMWMSNPHYHILAQLKGFQTVFGNTVLKRWYDMIARRGAFEGSKNAAKIATSGTLMVLTAMLGNELREFIKYGSEGHPKHKDEKPEQKIYRAMERAGFLGVFQFASDAMFANRFGSSSVAQLGGPTISQANEIIEAAGSALDGKNRPLAREMANAIPLANVIPSVRKDITDAIAGDVERSDRRIVRR